MAEKFQNENEIDQYNVALIKFFDSYKNKEEKAYDKTPLYSLSLNPYYSMKINLHGVPEVFFPNMPFTDNNIPLMLSRSHLVPRLEDRKRNDVKINEKILQYMFGG